METVQIGNARVSRIGLGTWAIGGLEWGAVPDEAAIATCLNAVERGINLIDTAPIYGHGRAEELIGKAMRAHGRREDFFVATKAGLEWNESGVFSNSTEQRLREEVEASLRRLATDHIDLYQLHWPDPLVPLRRVAELFDQFLRQGKVLAVGVSNFTAAQLEEFCAACPVVSNQSPYNIFEREIDAAVLPWCRQHDLAGLAYSSLCRSLLAGRVHREMSFDARDIRSADPKFRAPRFSQYMNAVEGLTALARDRFCKSLPELAVRWVLDRPGIAVALWGAKRPEQLDAAGGVMGWSLDSGAMAEIDRIVAECVSDPVGPEYLTPKVRQG